MDPPVLVRAARFNCPDLFYCSAPINAAERKILNTQKAAAKPDLRRTHLVAPFDVRIPDLKVNQAQYANKGQLLFLADDLDAAEIEARFPIGKFRPLMAGKTREQGDEGNTPAVQRTPVAVKLDAIVRLNTTTHTVEWRLLFRVPARYYPA